MAKHRASRLGAKDSTKVACGSKGQNEPAVAGPLVYISVVTRVKTRAKRPYLHIMSTHPTRPKLRVASYNIRKTRGLDQKRDPGRILRVINGLDADIVALQEADRRLGARPGALCRQMIAQETDFNVVPLARNDVSLGWHGNAVLLRKGLVAAGAKQLELPGLEPRGAVLVELELPFSVSIVGTHLGLLRRSRLAQMRAIGAALTGAGHQVLAGDFNEWSVKRGLEPLSPRFDIHAPGYSFHARRPVAALDRIALSRGLSMRQAGVDQSALARRASDHLPIWADIAPKHADDCDDSMSSIKTWRDV